jgi:hypothetical protein
VILHLEDTACKDPNLVAAFALAVDFAAELLVPCPNLGRIICIKAKKVLLNLKFEIGG